jgi:hypothetical protein
MKLKQNSIKKGEKTKSTWLIRNEICFSINSMLKDEVEKKKKKNLSQYG